MVDTVDEVAGWFTGGDIISLYRLVRQLAPGAKILELGSYRGRSTNAIGHGIKGSDAVVYCIDRWQSFDFDDVLPKIDPSVTALRPCDAAILEDFINNTTWLGPQLRMMRGSVSQYSDLLPEAFFDLIFIDADHSREGVTGDIGASLGWLKPGGILCGHDYWSGTPSVMKAVNEALFSRQDVQELGVVGGNGCMWFARVDS